MAKAESDKEKSKKSKERNKKWGKKKEEGRMGERMTYRRVGEKWAKADWADWEKQKAGEKGTPLRQESEETDKSQGDPKTKQPFRYIG